MPEDKAPVALFAYNRADKLENCIMHLEECPEAKETELFIFCDGSKGEKDRESVNRVQAFAKEYSRTSDDASRFRKVIVHTRENNCGLAASIISGVTKIVNEYGRVIVVEDDLVVKPSFLTFLNEGLDHYRDNKKCGSISAFTYPMKALDRFDKDVFVTHKADCWGWATWADRWNNAAWADTDFGSYLKDRKQRWRFERLEAGLDRLMYLQHKGKIDSWAIRWVYHLFDKGFLTVYPKESRVVNDGFDGSGTHCDDDRRGSKRAHDPGELENSQSQMPKTRWEKCEVNAALERAYAVFPRRKLIFYIPQTLYYLLRTS